MSPCRIEVVTADITTLEVDAIVNAANISLLGGGGVDGAIHAVAGPELLVACRQLGGCATGEAKLTPGFNLPARHVIHTVGPVWTGGEKREDELLGRCYRNTLALAAAAKLKSVAFPAISTGIYHFPKERAATIALREARNFATIPTSVERILFVAFDPVDAQIYRRLLAASPDGTPAEEEPAKG